MDELPRFAATREYILRYGDHWATWALPITGVALIGLLALAFADAAGVPARVVLPSIVSFGACMFLGGFFVGVVWSGLIEDAKERQKLKNA